MNNFFRLIASILRPHYPLSPKSISHLKIVRLDGLVLAIVLGYSSAAHAVLIDVSNGPNTFSIRTSVSTAGATTMMSPDAPYPFIPDDLISTYNTNATDGSGNFASTSYIFAFTNTDDAAVLSLTTTANFMNNTNGFGGTSVRMLAYLAPEVDVNYTLTGGFHGTLEGSGVAQSDILFLGTGILYNEEEQGYHTPTFQLDLDNLNPGGSAFDDYGPLSGVLLAGNEYMLDVGYYLNLGLFNRTEPGGGIGRSTLNLRMTPVAADTPPSGGDGMVSLPEGPTALLFGFGLLALAITRRLSF